MLVDPPVYTPKPNLLSRATGQRAKVGGFVFRILSATFVLWVCLRGTALAEVLYRIEELLPLPGYTVAHANAINDSGQVVGYSFDPFDTSLYITGLASATLWDDGAVSIIAEGTHWPGLNCIAYNATDINNSGQIVGISQIRDSFYPQSNGTFGSTSSGGAGTFMRLAPDASAPLPSGFPRCHLDDWTIAISDAGYMLSMGGVYSPNGPEQLCGVDVLELYESGLMHTTEGHLYDPLVNGARQWVTVPDCTGATGIAAEICALRDGELHNKVMNESGQFIMNVGDRAFLLTPCSPFPGGGSTEGCFPGNGPFPGSPNPGRSRFSQSP